MSQLDINAIEAVEDLARRSVAEQRVADLGDAHVPAHVVVRVTRDDESIEWHDLERLADTPRGMRGTAVLHDGPSFCTYVSRLADGGTTMWADPSAGEGRIVAVFDDHLPDSPGWREHRAELHAQLDPDWVAWRKMDGQLVGQKDFAQFLLDHTHTIADPAPAKLMPAVQQFTAARSAKYESAVNLTNGEVQMVYVEDIQHGSKGRQTVKLPDKITLGLWPYLGFPETVQAWPVVAHVRWQIPNDGGPLKIGVKLERPDLVRRQAWERLCDDVAAGCTHPAPVLLRSEDGPAEQQRLPVPLLQGSAPPPLRTTQTRTA